MQSSLTVALHGGAFASVGGAGVAVASGAGVAGAGAGSGAMGVVGPDGAAGGLGGVDGFDIWAMAAPEKPIRVTASVRRRVENVSIIVTSNGEPQTYTARKTPPSDCCVSRLTATRAKLRPTAECLLNKHERRDEPVRAWDEAGEFGFYCDQRHAAGKNPLLIAIANCDRSSASLGFRVSV
jgi:hypothetical protein